jgi:hypothetical protein
MLVCSKTKKRSDIRTCIGPSLTVVFISGVELMFAFLRRSFVVIVSLTKNGHFSDPITTFKSKLTRIELFLFSLREFIDEEIFIRRNSKK